MQHACTHAVHAWGGLGWGGLGFFVLPALSCRAGRWDAGRCSRGGMRDGCFAWACSSPRLASPALHPLAPCPAPRAPRTAMHGACATLHHRRVVAAGLQPPTRPTNQPTTNNPTGRDEAGADTGLVPVAIELAHDGTSPPPDHSHPWPKSGVVYSRFKLSADEATRPVWWLAKAVFKSIDESYHQVGGVPGVGLRVSFCWRGGGGGSLCSWYARHGRTNSQVGWRSACTGRFLKNRAPDRARSSAVHQNLRALPCTCTCTCTQAAAPPGT